MIPEVMENFEIILFDLGGVVVELTGVARMLELSTESMTEEELWHRWLTSETVRRFESGGCDAVEFAEGIVAEFGMEVETSQWIEEFTQWPRGLYPGVPDLLAGLADRFTLACLSNTNAVHWERMREEMGIERHFHRHFASHQIGMLKPDPEIFYHVAAELKTAPECILFLDDNELNVLGARSVGVNAHRVRGISEVRGFLVELGVLPEAEK